MSVRANLRFCRVASVLLLVAWNAPRAAAAASDAGQDLTLTARDLSDQALRQYQQGEFDAAIESFMGAFALSNNPGLLFNVAQAYRLKGDCARAGDYYQRYLSAVPETPLKASLERRVAEMRACVESGGATVAVTAGDSAHGADASAVTTTIARPAAPATEDIGSAPKPEASARRHAVVWTLRGTGAALLVSSAVFGALAWDAHRDADGAPTMRAAYDASNRYELDSALAWTFAASGVVCAVVSYIVGRQR